MNGTDVYCDLIVEAGMAAADIVGRAHTLFYAREHLSPNMRQMYLRDIRDRMHKLDKALTAAEYEANGVVVTPNEMCKIQRVIITPVPDGAQS